MNAATNDRQETTPLAHRAAQGIQDNPLGSALALAGVAALAGAGAWWLRRRKAWDALDDITDPLVDQQLHAGAVAY
ncbi:LPXTG cell wall anchor domain-containing protein [Sphingomicrobium lutaoense]|uniref:LPXTG-motif cell wall-anchored protein n=1 Tax=Sphingomicrobium lutaoense TaxID=515949 RepID=A0A839YXC0_9SPHN|nr:LPXTG cell wall anchor domain-containing protein [Sphingomicrobium lutaoense]MBB3763686.1 LPXTG-motif cell wall-anchored protein [Sphingomicrobium lutaoense]